MPDELRTQGRGLPLSREDWITKFVNVVVRELRPGLDRMIAVTAAREAWPRMHDTVPYLAAKEWVATSADS
jgi:hypothetical protein